ncbi:hypothetical protein, partial [Belliella pelovolcani]|uniref:hypothetical protein n=1 Tax=Belliella pelovolcani TaxID=529505 RepID=UPI00391A4CA7
MKKLINLLILGMIMLGSCTEDGIPNPPVEVEAQLTNTDGEPTWVFQEGEDILFEYSIINLTEETLTWYFDSLFNFQGMFT